jgi:hypothetical protein
MKVPQSAYGFGRLFLVLLAAVAVLPVVLRAIAPPCSEGFAWWNPFSNRASQAIQAQAVQRYGATYVNAANNAAASRVSWR